MTHYNIGLFLESFINETQDLHQIYFKTSFLNGYLCTGIFITQQEMLVNMKHLVYTYRIN